MPIYEYQCLSCGTRTEHLQKFSDPPLPACPKCGGEVKKLISSPAFQFKGSGWYVTDYAGKKGGDKPESASSGDSKAEGAKGEGSAAAKPTETKSESKSEAKPEKKETAAKGD